jgi:site-specific recombinase
MLSPDSRGNAPSAGQSTQQPLREPLTTTSGTETTFSPVQSKSKLNSRLPNALRKVIRSIHTAYLTEPAHTPPNPQYLIAIVAELRPPKTFLRRRRDIARINLELFVELLRTEPELCIVFRTYILELLRYTNHTPFYTESGILPQSGFFSEGFQKLTHLLLPPVHDVRSLRGLVNLVFHESDDYLWFQALPDEQIVMLFRVLGLAGYTAESALLAPSFDSNSLGLPHDTSAHDDFNPHHGMYGQLLNAMVTLSHKIAAMGLEPEITTRLPEFDAATSPFVAQHQELASYVQFVRGRHLPSSAENVDNTAAQMLDHALVMLNQCQDCVNYLRKRRDSFGTSLDLIYKMQRIHQHIRRLRALIKLTYVSDRHHPDTLARSIIELWKDVVEAENQQHSLSKYFNDLTELLAFQIVDNAAKTGEHYITTTREEFIRFFRASLGGGFIVAFCSVIKLGLYYAHFPPFGEAFLYGLNYAIGFMLIHIFGFALATKQPAMTASTIAESLDTRAPRKPHKGIHAAGHNEHEVPHSSHHELSETVKRGSDVSLPDLVVMIAQISRSQLISFVGNVAMALPMGVLLGLLFWITGSTIADEQKALKMISELHPLTSGSLFYAGIAGVFLFTAGLISGYYDNLVVHNKIADRVRQHPLLKKLLPKHRIERFAEYIRTNLGALAGNFFFGFMLGGAATLGFILGLPIDIRHITFAAANAALALTSLHFSVSLEQVLWTAVGIAGIGAMNFLVSFSLALLVALRSRKVNFRQTRELLKLLGRYFFTNTREFFLPPPAPTQATASTPSVS